ncbi:MULTISPECIES: DUF2474 family protein [Alcaligenaceae]|nr:DUF2474 family protein [Bordetella genomosp. 10]
MPSRVRGLAWMIVLWMGGVAAAGILALAFKLLMLGAVRL